MAKLRKAVVSGVAVAVGVLTIYEARQISQLREQNQTLQQQQVSVTGQIQQLQCERDDAANRLAALQAENSRLKSNPDQTELLKLRGEVTQLQGLVTKFESRSDDSTSSTAASLLKRVSLLKARLNQTLEARIPELDYLTDYDWLEVAKWKLETEEDYRRALAALRHQGESTVDSMFHNALVVFFVEHDEFPAEVAQLKPYFKSPIRDEILQRYQILPADKLKFPPEILKMVIGDKN